MYFLMSGKCQQSARLCLLAFNALRENEEFLFICYETAIRAESRTLACLVFSQPKSGSLLESLSAPNKVRVRRLVIGELLVAYGRRLHMHSYFCLRLLRSNQRVFRTESYGDVDIRNASMDSEAEIASIVASATSHSFVHDLHDCLRIVTIVDANSPSAANEMAQVLFEEAIDLFNQMNFSSQVESLLPIGFCRDLGSLAIFPIEKPKGASSWPIGAIFRCRLILFTNL